MALILINGGTKRKRERVYALAQWSAYELMHWRMADKIWLNIKICKLDVHGYCIWEDDNIKPREFNIEINNAITGADLDTTVLHEMVHVKQYAKNELRERFRRGYRKNWKGSKKNWGDIEYEKAPWEIEAYRMQEVLYKRWVKPNKWVDSTSLRGYSIL